MRMEHGLINRKRGAVKRENDKGEEKKVDLSGRGMDSFPSLSLNPATITKLDLSNNNLQTIPESLTALLVNVMILDVHSNQLKALPNSIGCLSKLKHLNVSSNHLESLPRTIENCRALEELIANFNKLTSLPDTIGFELTNIVRLSINSNKLCFLPPSTSHMLTLRSLDARLNCLRSLPDGLENLTQLESLDISQNFQYLTSLPYSLGLLLSLSTLDISYNSITSLPDSIGCLANLKVLKVEGNPLVCPPKKVRDLGIEVVRVYLRERMNKAERKKTSFIGRFVRCSVVKGGVLVGDEELMMDKHKLLQGFATPTREARLPTWMSPKRLFGSPRK